MRDGGSLLVLTVFPVRAGVFPDINRKIVAEERIPRECGGVSYFAPEFDAVNMYSP